MQSSKGAGVPYQLRNNINFRHRSSTHPMKVNIWGTIDIQVCHDIKEGYWTYGCLSFWLWAGLCKLFKSKSRFWWHSLSIFVVYDDTCVSRGTAAILLKVRCINNLSEALHLSRGCIASKSLKIGCITFQYLWKLLWKVKIKCKGGVPSIIRSVGPKVADENVNMHKG